MAQPDSDSTLRPGGRHCPNCNGPLPANAPSGQCPACLLRIGLALGDGGLAFALNNPPSDSGVAADVVRRVGDYEVLEEIAHGGMGVVYRARQLSLNRVVALKMIRAGQLADEGEVARFHAEAEAVAQLDHPNIVPIYEVGQHEGRHYYSMKFVEGGSLAARISNLNSPLSNRAAAALLAAVARAVHYAHQRGILHRDLKPGNILLDTRGQPHVADFGLARRLDADSTITRSGVIVGTPSYMAPEQAAGVKTLTTAADVFSLGAILYEILTGRPPFRGANVLDTLMRVQECAPKPPTTFVPHLDRDLQVICLRCLEKDPAGRYSSAAAFAEDLERWLRNETILARRASPSERLAKWARRRPAVAALLAGVAVVSVLGMAGILWQWRAAVTARNSEREQRQRAEMTGELLRRQVYVADMNLAEEALRASNLGRARELLERHNPKPGTTDLRGWEWRYLWAQCRNDASQALPPHRTGIRSAAVSPDGRWLAWGGVDGVIQVWDMPARRVAATLEAGSGDAATVAFSPRGDRLAASVRKGVVKLWAVDSWKETASLPHEGWVRWICFSPDGGLLACMGDNRRIDFWNLAKTNRVASILVGHLRDSHKCRIAFAPNQPWLVIGEADGRIRIIDLPAMTERLSFTGSVEGITALAVSPDGRTLASASGYDDFSIRLWNPDNGAALGRLAGHAGWVADLAFSPDGATLASAGADQTVRLWTAGIWTERATLRGHQHEVRTIAFASDGRSLVSGSRAGELLVWDASSAQRGRGPEAAQDSIRDAVFSPDGTSIAAWHHDGGISLRSVTNLDSVRRLTDLGTNNYGVLFSPDGRWLAVGTRAGTVRLLDAATLREARTLSCGEPSRVLPDGFSRDGRLFLGTARIEPDPVCHLWAADSGQALASWPVGPQNRQVALSPDGLVVVTGDLDGAVRLWDAAAGREIKRLGAHRSEVVGVKFSADGRLLATGSSYGDVMVWDVPARAQLAVLPNRSGAIASLTISPDGRRLAIGGHAPQSVQLWDVATGQALTTLTAPGAGHGSVQFSADGHALLTVNNAGTLHQWRAPSFAEIEGWPGN